MKKNECNVVRDLMPLVLDRVASDESRELIEEHIASCEECRKQYDEMRSALPEETRVEYEEDRKQFTDALKSVRKQRLKRRIRMIALAAIVCLAVMLAGLFAYDALFWKMSMALRRMNLQETTVAGTSSYLLPTLLMEILKRIRQLSSIRPTATGGPSACLTT